MAPCKQEQWHQSEAKELLAGENAKEAAKAFGLVAFPAASVFPVSKIAKTRIGLMDNLIPCLK